MSTSHRVIIGDWKGETEDRKLLTRASLTGEKSPKLWRRMEDVRKLHSGGAEMASQKVYKQDQLKTSKEEHNRLLRLKRNYSERCFFSVPDRKERWALPLEWKGDADEQSWSDPFLTLKVYGKAWRCGKNNRQLVAFLLKFWQDHLRSDRGRLPSKPHLFTNRFSAFSHYLIKNAWPLDNSQIYIKWNSDK